MCRSGACGDQALQPASCASRWLVQQKTDEATGRIGDF
jgi:hypothetical protein